MIRAPGRWYIRRLVPGVVMRDCYATVAKTDFLALI